MGQDKYIVLTNHSVDFVMEICRHITVSKFGKETPEGTPKEIRQNEEVEEVIDAYFAKM